MYLWSILTLLLGISTQQCSVHAALVRCECEPGAPGSVGPPGYDGPPGRPGSRGDVGRDGVPGQQGVRGVAGTNGYFVLTSGAAPIGPVGLPGLQGPPGYPDYCGDCSSNWGWGDRRFDDEHHHGILFDEYEHYRTAHHNDLHRLGIRDDNIIEVPTRNRVQQSNQRITPSNYPSSPQYPDADYNEWQEQPPEDEIYDASKHRDRQPPMRDHKIPHSYNRHDGSFTDYYTGGTTDEDYEAFQRTLEKLRQKYMGSNTPKDHSRSAGRYGAQDKTPIAIIL